MSIGVSEPQHSLIRNAVQIRYCFTPWFLIQHCNITHRSAKNSVSQPHTTMYCQVAISLLVLECLRAPLGKGPRIYSVIGLERFEFLLKPHEAFMKRSRTLRLRL